MDDLNRAATTVQDLQEAADTRLPTITRRVVDKDDTSLGQRLDCVWVTTVRLHGGCIISGVESSSDQDSATELAAQRAGGLYKKKLPLTILSMFTWLN